MNTCGYHRHINYNQSHTISNDLDQTFFHTTQLCTSGTISFIVLGAWFWQIESVDWYFLLDYDSIIGLQMWETFVCLQRDWIEGVVTAKVLSSLKNGPLSYKVLQPRHVKGLEELFVSKRRNFQKQPRSNNTVPHTFTQ